jgi:hypothetical protein
MLNDHFLSLLIRGRQCFENAAELCPHEIRTVFPKFPCRIHGGALAGTMPLHLIVTVPSTTLLVMNADARARTMATCANTAR